MNIPKIYTLDQAKKTMERYCIYQERCHKEVRKKLNEYGLFGETTDKVLAHLIENDFLNETRFSLQYVKGKFQIKNWGRVRLKRELKVREIGTYNIKLALEQINETEYLKKFEELTEKKWHSVKEKNILKKKKKVFDYLTYRGWESYLIYDKLRELSKY